MIKFFKKEKKFKKENSFLDVNFYWEIVVAIIFISCIASASFGYYLFMDINKDVVLKVDDTSGKVETIKKENLDKALEYFRMRKESSDKIITTTSLVTDPSL